jgi:hypothetical protein
MSLKQGNKVRFVKGIEAEANYNTTFTCGSNEIENKVFIEELGVWYYADAFGKIN